MSFKQEWDAAKDQFEQLTGLSPIAAKTWVFRRTGTVDKTLELCDQGVAALDGEERLWGLQALNEGLGRYTAARDEYLFILDRAGKDPEGEHRFEMTTSYRKAVLLLESRLHDLEAKIRHDLLVAMNG